MALHQLPNPLLAHADAARQQLSPDARPAIGSTALGMEGLDRHRQSLVPQVATRCRAGVAHEVIVVARHAHAQHPALHRERPHPAVALDEGVL